MAKSSFFPDMITRLPEADVAFPKFKGWIFQGKEDQIVFLEADTTYEEPHSHGAQYTMVLRGEITITIGNEAKRYGPSDTFYIPNGVVHSAVIHNPYSCVVYFEGQRYKPKKI